MLLLLQDIFEGFLILKVGTHINFKYNWFYTFYRALFFFTLCRLPFSYKYINIFEIRESFSCVLRINIKYWKLERAVRKVWDLYIRKPIQTVRVQLDTCRNTDFTCALWRLVGTEVCCSESFWSDLSWQLTAQPLSENFPPRREAASATLTCTLSLGQPVC